MQLNISNHWEAFFNLECDKPYFKNLMQYVTQEYTNYKCYPPENLIFNAFNLCDLNCVKVVILGQDPYPNKNQAHGLCFSVNDGIAHPPSLINIFKELETDVHKPYPKSGNLKHWADQGVLLLNATLTVREHAAGSHQKKGWETFSNAVITHLNKTQSGIVFLLWGAYAKQNIKHINTTKHYVLNSGHPSPLSANRGYWFGNKHFSTTNTILKSLGKPPINW